MNQAGFSPWLHKLLWCEAAQTTTDTDNILVLEKKMLHPSQGCMAMMPSIVNTFDPLAKCLLQLSMPISKQAQKLIHKDNFACLVAIIQLMLVMCITLFIQKPIKSFTVTMFNG